VVTTTESTYVVGDVRIDAIVDAATLMPTEEMFAETAAPSEPGELGVRYPDDFTSTSWRFVVRCFLVRGPDTTILVDAGVGPATLPMPRHLGMAGNLMEKLAQLEADIDDIEHVVLTHAHGDHVGWAIDESGRRPVARFPNARYHLGAADLADSLEDSDSEYLREYRDRIYGPLAVSDRLETGGPETRQLAPGISLHSAPGHTTGHQIVIVEDNLTRVLLVGDLLHFSYQLDDPTINGPWDAAPDLAATSRVQLLRGSAGKQLVVGSPHLPKAFTVLAG
jgi:glyoxylase-like metal-dependent hydrolase (beta-lactamase superfamily II)